MDIIIVCNQVDCAHNSYGEILVRFPEGSVSGHICAHKHPAVQFYGGHTGTICNTKHVPKSHYPTICAMCDTQDSEVCITCPHQKMKI